VKATICDVGPRGGLQPQMAGAEEVAAGIERRQGTVYAGLVRAWLEETLGRELPGQVYRAGTFAPVAG
jgi:hypothetical protein